MYKILHVKLLNGTHTRFKMKAHELGLSMQSIADELFMRVGEGDPYIVNVLKELKQRQLDEQNISLNSMDADTILDCIEGKKT